MNRPLLAAAGLASCVLLNACGDGGGATPTAPTEPAALQATAPKPPPQTPATQASATGNISMVASSPGSGASLLVGECHFGNVARSCADGWRGTFNVSLDRDLPWAVLSVGFYEGPVLCGYAADVQQLVPAGQTVTFRPSWISLSDEFGSFPSPCRLPATTTRIVAVLWSDADWTTQLTQEFSASYTFIRP
jgi:hypothetical protein